MDARTRSGLIVSLIMAAAPAAAQTSSETSATPATPQATSEAPAAGESPSALIARGEAVYNGPGNCYACHGAKAAGLVGPNLTDAEWIHSKGTLEDIEKQIIEGVSKEEAKSGIPMPPKGGSTISDEDIKACAAYVHSLSQKSGS